MVKRFYLNVFDKKYSFKKTRRKCRHIKKTSSILVKMAIFTATFIYMTYSTYLPCLSIAFCTKRRKSKATFKLSTS